MKCSAPNCDAYFSAAPGKRYCSDRCRQAAYVARQGHTATDDSAFRREYGFVWRTCEVCARTFPMYGSTGRFCGDRCRKAAKRSSPPGAESGLDVNRTTSPIAVADGLTLSDQRHAGRPA